MHQVFTPSFPLRGGDYMLTDLQREGVCASDTVTGEWKLPKVISLTPHLK